MDVIPETRRQEELVRLRPIKVFPEKLAMRIPVFVGPIAEVILEGLPYSMEPEATHIAGTLFLYEDRLHIIAGCFESHNRRRKKGDPPAPLPEHRAAKIAAVHGKRAKLYEKRQQVLNLGPDALALLTEITHREPPDASVAAPCCHARAALGRGPLDDEGGPAMTRPVTPESICRTCGAPSGGPRSRWTPSCSRAAIWAGCPPCIPSLTPRPPR